MEWCGYLGGCVREGKTFLDEAKASFIHSSLTLSLPYIESVTVKITNKNK